MTATVSDLRGAPQAVGSASGLRVAVIAHAGYVDLVVPREAMPTDLLRELAAPAGMVLVQRSGAPLVADQALGAQGVADGDVLAIVVGSSVGAAEPTVAAPVSVLNPLRRLGTAAAGALAIVLVGLAAGVASSSADLAGRAGVAGALFALTAAVLMLVGTGRAGDAAIGAPILAAAGVVALLDRSELGSDLVTILAAGVVAAQVAMLARYLSVRGGHAGAEALLVVAWAGGLLAAIAALVMTGDGAPRAVWAAVVAIAVCASRLLPRVAIDVPDEQILDTERMAATTWSARTVARRRRVRVHGGDVATAVAAGRRLFDTGAVIAAAMACAGAVALSLDPGSGSTRWAAFATAGLAGVAMAIRSRSYAQPVPRLALRAGGLAALLTGAGTALAATSNPGLYAVAGGCLILALGSLSAAVALGHGWRSVWWARLGDTVETLSIGVLLPVAMYAAGTFAHMRAMLSN